MIFFLHPCFFANRLLNLNMYRNDIRNIFHNTEQKGFKKIIVRYKKIGFNINVMRQTACLVVNPIKVNSFAYLFNCTTVGRTSD